MANRIITINRMYGSNGRKLGKALAKELGIHYYDRELIQIASEKEGIPYEELLKVDEKRASQWRYPLEDPIQMAPQYRLSNPVSKPLPDAWIFLKKMPPDLLRNWIKNAVATMNILPTGNGWICRGMTFASTAAVFQSSRFFRC